MKDIFVTYHTTEYKMEKVRLDILISQSLYKDLQTMATDSGMSFADIVSQGLELLKNAKKEKTHFSHTVVAIDTIEQVCILPNGYILFREPNGVGGHHYWSNEIGGGVSVWDTCTVDSSTLLYAIAEEERRKRIELLPSRELP